MCCVPTDRIQQKIDAKTASDDKKYTRMFWKTPHFGPSAPFYPLKEGYGGVGTSEWLATYSLRRFHDTLLFSGGHSFL